MNLTSVNLSDCRNKGLNFQAFKTEMKFPIDFFSKRAVSYDHYSQRSIWKIPEGVKDATKFLEVDGKIVNPGDKLIIMIQNEGTLKPAVLVGKFIDAVVDEGEQLFWNRGSDNDKFYLMTHTIGMDINGEKKLIPVQFHSNNCFMNEKTYLSDLNRSKDIQFFADEKSFLDAVDKLKTKANEKIENLKKDIKKFVSSKKEEMGIQKRTIDLLTTEALVASEQLQKL